MFTEFDMHTGLNFSREEGDIWQESSGADSLGWFTARKGRKIPIVMDDWTWRWTWCWLQDPEATTLVRNAVASGELDRQNPQGRANFRALLAELEARVKAR